MSIVTVEQERDLDLEEVGVLLDNEFAAEFGGTGRQFGKERSDLSRREIVDG
jgi:hypothetical protein